MVIIGAMAVLTADWSMGRVFDIVVLVLMAINAYLGGLVFDRKLFPLGLIADSVPAVHVATVMDAKILWY